MSLKLPPIAWTVIVGVTIILICFLLMYIDRIKTVWDERY